MMKRRNFLKILGLGFGAIFVKPTDVPEITSKIETLPGKIEDWVVDEVKSLESVTTTNAPSKVIYTSYKSISGSLVTMCPMVSGSAVYPFLLKS